MKKLLAPFCFILVINFSSCEVDNPNNIFSGDINVITGENALVGMSRDAFELTAISVMENQLEIHIGYSGGCEDHGVSLRWDGSWITDNDVPVAEVYIDHENNNDNCEAYLSETRTINIDDLFSEDFSDDALIKFINSSDQDRIIYYSKSFQWVDQSTACMVEIDLEEALCGWGEWGNFWFNVADEEEGDFRKYLQPVIAPDGFDTPELGRYRIGVKFMYGYQFQAATCLAYPGEWMPVEVTCIERVL